MRPTPRPPPPAATVRTKKTTPCPATPYVCANAMNVRFTAFSISSTHMKMMIALRRVSTPTTPIVNSTAEKKSDSASIRFLTSREGDGADDGRQQQNAGDLERQQILVEQGAGHRLDRAVSGDLIGGIAGGQSRGLRRFCSHGREDHGEDRQASSAGDLFPRHASRVGQLARMPEIEQHDDE